MKALLRGLTTAVAVMLMGASLAGCSPKAAHQQSRAQSSHDGSQSSSAPATSRPDDGKRNVQQSSPPAPTSATDTKSRPAQGTSSAAPKPQQQAPQECVASQLGFELIDIPHTAGDNNFGLSAVNKGKNPCSIKGWPGVSFLDSAGKPIGEPAVWTGDGTQHPALQLQSGQSALALLELPVTADKNADKDTAAVCAEVDAAKVSIIPPDQTKQILIPAQTPLYNPLRLCSHLYRAKILPFTDPSQFK